MKLSEVKMGDECIIVKNTADGALSRRIMDMGFTKGVRVKCVKLAPLGDPIEFALRGYNVSLRRAEAENIVVKEG